MPSLEQDWSFIQIAAVELDDYILSAELYWPLTSKSRAQLPPLTPGNLLLCRARLSAFAWASSRQGELSKALGAGGRSLTKWSANWERKALREYGERLRLWQNYLNDLASDPMKNKNSYPQQVRGRVILQLLDEEFNASGGQTGNPLQGLDSRLRLLTHDSNFCWEEEIQNAFPREKYWFLYLMI